MTGIAPWLRESRPEPDEGPTLTWADLTPEDVKNGWTPDTLSAYLAERRQAQSAVVANRRPQRPTMQNSGLRLNGRMIKPSWHR